MAWVGISKAMLYLNSTAWFLTGLQSASLWKILPREVFPKDFPRWRAAQPCPCVPNPAVGSSGHSWCPAAGKGPWVSLACPSPIAPSQSCCSYPNSTSTSSQQTQLVHGQSRNLPFVPELFLSPGTANISCANTQSYSQTSALSWNGTSFNPHSCITLKFTP